MFETKNIKISITITKLSLNSVLNQLDESNTEYEIKNNYIIIRDKFVYIFFKSKTNTINHINITKLSKLSDIESSIEILKECVFKQFYFEVLSKKIDNITATYDKKEEINQIELLDKIKDKYKVRFNKEKFPGLFIKLPTGTFIIFHTGKINVVGCHDTSHLFKLYEELKVILNYKTGEDDKLHMPT